MAQTKRLVNTTEESRDIKRGPTKGWSKEEVLWEEVLRRRSRKGPRRSCPTKVVFAKRPRKVVFAKRPEVMTTGGGRDEKRVVFEKRPEVMTTGSGRDEKRVVFAKRSEFMTTEGGRDEKRVIFAKRPEVRTTGGLDNEEIQAQRRSKPKRKHRGGQDKGKRSKHRRGKRTPKLQHSNQPTKPTENLVEVRVNQLKLIPKS